MKMIKSAACGVNNSMLVLSGNVYAVGSTKDGLVPHKEVSKKSDKSNEGFFTRIDWFYFNRIKITGVACGLRHCLAWNKPGRVFSWGSSLDGALGYDLTGG